MHKDQVPHYGAAHSNEFYEHRSHKRRAGEGAPGSSAFQFRLSLIDVSFPTNASEFRKCGSNHVMKSPPCLLRTYSKCISGATFELQHLNVKRYRARSSETGGR